MQWFMRLIKMQKITALPFFVSAPLLTKKGSSKKEDQRDG
jgi:hypothetical protein